MQRFAQRSKSADFSHDLYLQQQQEGSDHDKSMRTARIQNYQSEDANELRKTSESGSSDPDTKHSRRNRKSTSSKKKSKRSSSSFRRKKKKSSKSKSKKHDSASDTEPNTCSSDSDHHHHRDKFSPSESDDPMTCSNDDHGEFGRTNRPSKKKKKKSRAVTRVALKGSSSSTSTINSKTRGNPFANTGEAYLGKEMLVLAEGLNLDVNTRTMLAYYDARSLEDFCMMSQSDIVDLLLKARSMNRALPPLQIRKVQVLRMWARNLSQSKGDAPNLVPADWKKKFRNDLPMLKQSLRSEGEASHMSAPVAPQPVFGIRSLFRFATCGTMS